MPEGATTKDYATLRDDVDALRKDLANLTEKMRGMSGERFESARAQAREAAQRVRDRGQAAVDEVGHRIEERPLTSVAVAFGVGMLIGRLLDRR